MEWLSHPITITVLSACIIALVSGFVAFIRGQINEVLKEIELARIDINAMDYAVEQSLPRNRYADYRAHKKDELMKNSKFIKSEK